MAKVCNQAEWSSLKGIHRLVSLNPHKKTLKTVPSLSFEWPKAHLIIWASI